MLNKWSLTDCKLYFKMMTYNDINCLCIVYPINLLKSFEINFDDVQSSEFFSSDWEWCFVLWHISNYNNSIFDHSFCLKYLDFQGKITFSPPFSPNFQTDSLKDVINIHLFVLSSKIIVTLIENSNQLRMCDKKTLRMNFNYLKAVFQPN